MDIDMRKNQNNSLRAYIKLILEAKREKRSIKQTDSAGPGVSVDPTAAGTPYDNYNIERGVDIYGYWYKSPGDKSTGGNFRPDDAAEYIGMSPPAAPASPADINAEADEIDQDVLDEFDQFDDNS